MGTKKNQSSFLDLLPGVNRVYLRTTTAFKRMNKWIIRVSKNRTKKKSQIHPKVAITNNTFTGVRKLYAKFRISMEGYPAWLHAVLMYGKEGQTGDNFFYHINYDKVVGKVVACFHLFRFSIGPRLLPWDLTATTEGRIITISWNDHRHTPHCAPNDLLLVGIIGEKKPGRPILLVAPDATRKSGSLELELAPKLRLGSTIHLYPFFCNAERTEFSDSQHLEVTVDL
ncbi:MULTISPECIES: hypothetical protein [unclassified Butyricimonas]|uniref:hypothetical protein n=1 Tax=unclassified Butyricimonas TaxID=2637652 RepID=UPI000C072F62|nr:MULTISPECIES: hypothetical protein [unclassified Butyricimonas]